MEEAMVNYMRDQTGSQGLIDLCDYIKKEYDESLINTIIEIGSFAGESSVIFAEQFPRAEIICIDPWLSGYDEKDSASHFNMKDIEKAFNSRTKKYKNITKLKEFSINAFYSCDIVYIDGCHTYEAVKEDILHWKELAEFAIAGHDYIVDEKIYKIHSHIQGVKKAVLEILGEPDMIFQDSSWIKKIL